MSPFAGNFQRANKLRRRLLTLAAMLVALLVHVAIAAPFIWRPTVNSPPPAPPALEVAMFVLAPQITEESHEEPEQEAEPKVEPERVEVPAEVVLEKKINPPPKRERKPEKKPEPIQEDLEKTPQPLQQLAEKNALEAERKLAPVGGVGQEALDAERRWRDEVRLHIERRKRYPRQAQRMRQEGVPVVHFKLDSQGNVVQADLEKGSGVASLDTEALLLVKRAQPLPLPPAALLAKGGGVVNISLPIEFTLIAGRI